MRGINLARRPFVNQRPVLRLAILLWVIGAALAILNVRLYSDHWRGTHANREALEKKEAEIGAEQAELATLDRALRGVKRGSQNRQVGFLNQLIAYRTFPWSALFDDLEEMLPREIKLHSVKPDVMLKTQPEPPPRRQRRGRRLRPETAAKDATAEESGADGEPAGGAEASTETTAREIPLRRDEVRLQLNGVARTEDALVELIQELYANPSFRDPFIPGESIQPDGSVGFNLSTIYLTRRRVPETEPEPTVVAEEPEAGEAGTAVEVAVEAGAELGAEGSEAGGIGDAPAPRAAPGAARRRSTVTAGGDSNVAAPSAPGDAVPRATAGPLVTAAAPSAPGTAVPGVTAAAPSAPGDAGPGVTAAAAPPPIPPAPPDSPEEPVQPGSGAPDSPPPDDPSSEQPSASDPPGLKRGSLRGRVPGGSEWMDLVRHLSPEAAK